MAKFSWRDLVAAGVHFGHRASRWDPRMKPYIFGRRNQIHIIDLKETVKGLLRAQRFLASVARRGDDVLFVGTKRQARQTIKEQAERCSMPYVSERWLGGTLTNFRTVVSRLSRLEELERMETDGTFESLSKKEVSSLRRELRKVRRNLGGLRAMKSLPGALLIVDPRHERISVREAVKLGIPVVALADTDGNPGALDIVIPGNDDALRSVGLIIQLLGDALVDGVAGRRAPVERAKREPRAEVRPRPAARKPADTEGEAATATVTETVTDTPAEEKPVADQPVEGPSEAAPNETTDEQAESAPS